MEMENLEMQALCFWSYKNRELKVKLKSWSSQKKTRGPFLSHIFCAKEIFWNV